MNKLNEKEAEMDATTVAVVCLMKMQFSLPRLMLRPTVGRLLADEAKTHQAR